MTSNILNRAQRRVALAILATLALVGLVMALPQPAHAASTASISGTVSGAGSPTVPLKSVRVVAFELNGQIAASATTGATGAYTVTGLPPGTYSLWFDNTANAAFAAQTWWNQKPSAASATYFDVADGQAAKGRNIVLDRITTITGTVKGSGSPDIPLEGIDVHAYGSTGTEAGGARTDSAGRYSILVPRGGPYTVAFNRTTKNVYLSPTWLGGAATQPLSEVITVTSGTTSGGHDIVLPKSASISGTVKRAGSPATAAPNTFVSAVAAAGSGGNGGQATSDASGNYTITGLAPGSYRLNFQGERGSGFVENIWFNGKTSVAAADPVTVTTGQVVTGRNITLAKGSTVSGTITVDGPASGAGSYLVQAYSADDGVRVGQTSSDADGKYTLTGLAAGAYTLKLLNYTKTDYVRLSWFGGGQMQSGATVIPVAAATAVTGKNAVLPKGATLSGTVKNADGNPLDRVSVGVWNADGTRASWEDFPPVKTAADGKYIVRGLPAGDYKVGFSDIPNQAQWDGTGGTVYQDEYYNNKTTLDAATLVTLAPTQATVANAVLQLKLKKLATTSTPAVSGTAKVGKTLTAVPGTWVPGPVTLTYQWKAGGAVIAGATASTYKVEPGDVGKTLTVSLTGTKPGYATVTKTSAATAAVVG